MRTHSSQSITITGQTTVGQVAKWFGTIPAEARLRVTVLKGDRPMDSDQTTMTASWDAEVTL